MWANSMAILACGLLLAVIRITTAENDKVYKKRQIYREQVLPHAGGRVPDTAFETDRLFLNRLQKEGIAIPDGVSLEQRNPQVYPFQNKISRAVFRVALSSDGRFTSKSGRFIYDNLPAVDTTYLYPQIHGQKTDSAQSTPVYPIYRQLQVPNPHINLLEFQPKKKAHLLDFADVAAKEPVKQYKSTSYQNFNLVSLPAPYKPPTTTEANARRVGEQELQTYFYSDQEQYIPSDQLINLNPFNSFDYLVPRVPFYEPNTEGQLYNTVPSIDLPTGFGTAPDQLLYR